MAEEDQSQKTEEPTHKKLEDAHKKGDVAKSQEVTAWFSLAAGTFVIAFFASGMSSDLAGVLIKFIAAPHTVEMEPGGVLQMSRDLVHDVLIILVFPLLLLVGAGVAGNLVQHRPLFTTEKMKPKLSKISPLSGAKKLFSPTSLVNFGKGIAKLMIVGCVGTFILWPDRDRLAEIVTYDVAVILPFVQAEALKLLGGVLAVLAVITVLDFAYQRFEFIKRMRMTKQEVKDEHKQMEGDPFVKGKLRQIRMERGRQRMMANVPEASVVLTNPTHYSVALKYEPGMAAPVCVAKGADLVAMKIREIAKESNVPLVENPPLTRALFATVEVDDEIPPEHYKAVAQVISYVMQLKGKLPKAATGIR